MLPVAQPPRTNGRRKNVQRGQTQLFTNEIFPGDMTPWSLHIKGTEKQLILSFQGRGWGGLAVGAQCQGVYGASIAASIWASDGRTGI